MYFWIFYAILSAQKNFHPKLFWVKQGATQCYQAFLVFIRCFLVFVIWLSLNIYTSFGPTFCLSPCPHSCANPTPPLRKTNAFVASFRIFRHACLAEWLFFFWLCMSVHRPPSLRMWLLPPRKKKKYFDQNSFSPKNKMTQTSCSHISGCFIFAFFQLLLNCFPFPQKAMQVCQTDPPLLVEWVPFSTLSCATCMCRCDTSILFCFVAERVDFSHFSAVGFSTGGGGKQILTKKKKKKRPEQKSESEHSEVFRSSFIFFFNFYYFFYLFIYFILVNERKSCFIDWLFCGREVRVYPPRKAYCISEWTDHVMRHVTVYLSDCVYMFVRQSPQKATRTSCREHTTTGTRR